jgi:hypothetical protein
MFLFADTHTLSNFTGQTESAAASTGSSLSTGDLRRRYNFGSMVSELAIAQDPFFRFVSTLRKQATDDPQFKFSEERPSFHKRYAYVIAHGTTSGVTSTADATVTAANIDPGDTYYFKLASDYKSAGNVGNKIGQSTGAISVAATGTRPTWIFAGLKLRVPFGSAYNVPNDYIVVMVEEVTTSGEYVIVKATVVKDLKTDTNNELQWLSATAPMSTTYSVARSNIAANLESKKVVASGNAFAKGSGYPDNWFDQPYSTGYGMTQIWKTSLGMDNSTRATVLKYAGNEFARIWANKLIDHKWDIEQDGLFSSLYTDSNGIQYTQGAVDYITNYGNIFALAHASKTCDGFLDDLSEFVEPRYNSSNATVFFCDTFTYNWLNKLSGYFNNNVQISPNFRADFAFKGTSSKLGVAVNKISTIYGDMNVVRNIHLDGTGVSIAAINMNYVKYRPLVGNGLNRDTAVYVGVQTLENSGVDKRVDLIQTEAGFQWMMPEAHALWLAE